MEFKCLVCGKIVGISVEDIDNKGNKIVRPFR